MGQNVTVDVVNLNFYWTEFIVVHIVANFLNSPSNHSAFNILFLTN